MLMFVSEPRSNLYFFRFQLNNIFFLQNYLNQETKKELTKIVSWFLGKFLFESGGRGLQTT
jgi:hypothetical protein